jgi:site-specific DNA-methyltransferase (adenine-specific)
MFEDINEPLNLAENGNSTKPLLPAVPSSEVYLEDCVKALKRYADNHFDLAIVDPPYMDGDNKALNTLGTNRTKYNIETFNIAPKQDYFDELFRVSKNQVVWGGNYFTDFLPVSRCWLMWDKIQDLEQFSDFELAWTSFDKVAKKYTKVSKGGFLTNGTIDQKIHPTQKPVGLYSWIMKKYAKEGDLILDTHIGSGSSRIAASLGGFNFVGFEIDKEYYDKQEKRFNDFKSQLRLF